LVKCGDVDVAVGKMRGTTVGLKVQGGW